MERYDPQKLEVRTPMLEIFTAKKKEKHTLQAPGRIKMCRTHKVCQSLKPFLLGGYVFFQGVLPEVVYVFEELPINS